MLVDSHCHLNFPVLKEQVSEIVNRAQDNQVMYMQTICTKRSEFPEILEIAESYENIYCSVGIHPCSSLDEKLFTPEELINISKHPKVIGFGETGLDYYHDGFDKHSQQESFLAHIHASQKTNIPVIIHCREAEDDVLSILKAALKEQEFKFLIHCFTGSYAFAKEILDLDGYISSSGIVTFKNAKGLQEIMKTIPLDRLLVETDAPYLAPSPHRGKTNEPAYTFYVAEFLANLRGEDYKIFADQTTNNFFRLFSKAKDFLNKDNI